MVYLVVSTGNVKEPLYYMIRPYSGEWTNDIERAWRFDSIAAANNCARIFDGVVIEYNPLKLKTITETNINEIARLAHKTASEKGFWDEDRNVGEMLMLIVSECSEALEADRNQHHAKRDDFELLINADDSDENFMHVFEGAIKNTFEDELADVLIRTLDTLYSTGVDIAWHIKMKMKYNSLRPSKWKRY